MGGTVEPVEITLSKAITLQGRVVDTRGRPVEGAFVNVDTWRRYRGLRVHLYTDADGRFRWDDAPPERVIINVDREGFRGLFQVPAVVGIEPLALTIQPSVRVAGTVRDASTGKPVMTAKVKFSAIDPETGEALRWESPPEIGWTTYSDGVLNLNAAVEGDAFKVQIAANGYQTYLSRIFRRDESPVLDQEIKLVPAKVEP